MGWILFFISGLVNILFIWYFRQLIIRLRIFSTSVEQIFSSLNEYLTHLDEVYELETYYGDTTLHELLRHSKDLAEEIAEAQQTISLFIEEEPGESFDGQKGERLDDKKED